MKTNLRSKAETPKGAWIEIPNGSWERLNTENERLKRENDELMERLTHAQRVITEHIALNTRSDKGDCGAH